MLRVRRNNGVYLRLQRGRHQTKGRALPMRLPKRTLLLIATGLAVIALAGSAFVYHTANTHAAPAAGSPSSISVQQVMSAAQSHHIAGVIVAGDSSITGEHHKPTPGGP